MLHDERGYILLFVLILTTALSSLMAGQMSLLGYEDKVLLERSQHRADVVAAKMALKAILHQDFSTCQIAPISPAAMIEQRAAWWEEKACQYTVGSMRAYYVSEQLLRDNCTVLDNGQPVAGDYERITMLYSGPTRVVLQAIAIRANARQELCTSETRVIHPGMQWVREL